MRICDRRIAAKVYQMVARPTVMYDLDSVALTKKWGAELGVTRMGRIRSSLPPKLELQG